MKTLYENFNKLLGSVTLDFKRYIYPKILWDERMIGIVGPRGVGKTTMILQYIKENLDRKTALYVSADDFYFAEHTLLDLAGRFSKYGGKNLFIDEIHKYADWSKSLKLMYDYFPDLKIVFTGSSILDIMKGSSDLSRRALIFKMQGLSFREYLQFFHNKTVEPLSLQEIIEHKSNDAGIKLPLPLFNDYLKRGYYPFGVDSKSFQMRLQQIILHTLETDIPVYANMNVTTGRKLRKLLSIIAKSVPFKPNFTKLASMIEASRNSIDDYCYFMEQAGLIAQLREQGEGIGLLGKIDKIYLDNTNLSYCLAQEKPDIGNLRETFFFNQMKVNNEIYVSAKADFNIGNRTFEVGGKSKNQSQIAGLKNACIVKDDIEYAYQNVIPLWAFGLNY
ncbi:MAG: AAA family ATPase [Bacteroidales bacterium]|nr:AAA family ATPase [Bacteroidales bacterium]